MKKHSQLCSVEKLYLGLADLLTSFQVTVLLVVELGFATQYASKHCDKTEDVWDWLVAPGKMRTFIFGLAPVW
jgi:hypothetical protein